MHYRQNSALGENASQIYPHVRKKKCCLHTFRRILKQEERQSDKTDGNVYGEKEQKEKVIDNNAHQS